MHCDAVVDRLAALLDEELAPGEVELVGRHIETCPDCAGLMDRMAAQRFSQPELVVLERPDFWGPMDAALDRAWADHEAPALQAAPAPPPWYRRELRLPAGVALLYAAGMLLALGLAGALWQEASDAHAQVAELQGVVDDQSALASTPLPVEPVSFVSRAPYRGSL